MPDTNPLLQQWQLPPWSAIRAEHLLPAVERIVADNLLIIENVIATQVDHPNWDDVVIAIDEADARLDETMAIIEFLSISHADEPQWLMQEALSTHAAQRYKTAKAGNRQLLQVYQRLAQSPIAASFSDARKASLAKILRRFHLAGSQLSSAQRKDLARSNGEIDLLEKRFMSNLKSVNAAWRKDIDDAALLAGLPADTQAHLAVNAHKAGLSGWRLTLDQNTYQQVMKRAQHRGLREEYFQAWCTRASDQGPHAGRFDNGPVLQTLLAARHAKARLLGFDNFAHLRLHNRMATGTDQVGRFLRQQIALNALSLAGETDDLQALAREHGVEQLEAWDHDFLAEQLRLKQSGGADQDLRQFFALQATLHSLCRFSEHMFGISISENTTQERFAENVRLFEISERQQPVGYIYIDPFHRDAGNDYAWTGVLRNRRITAEGRPLLPIASLQCNYPAAENGQTHLLDPQDLRVLLHEFGHCLHHVLTRSPHYNLSGISHLSRDAAEFVGQLFEKWALSGQFLRWMGTHHQSGERLSEAQANTAFSATGIQRSRETAMLLLNALVDFELHCSHGDGRTVQQVMADVQSAFPGLHIPAYCRFANSCDYLVTGYEASLYAYKWSGVLASEAFKRFEREGLFNEQTGRDMREHLLSGDRQALPAALQAFLGKPIDSALFPAPAD